MFTKIYENFDLLIEPSRDDYRARVVNSPFGQAVTDFVLPFSTEELTSFFELSGRVYRGMKFDGTMGAPSAEPFDPKQFGTRLYNSAFAGDVGKCLIRSLDESTRCDVGLRIRLRLDQSVPELADLPWEYLYVPDLRRFPVLSDRTPLVRYIEQMQREEPLRIKPPLRMAVMLSNPSDVTPLNVEQEWVRLREAVVELESRGLMIVERIADATLHALQDRLRNGDVHILHYIGHGFFDANRGEGGLILEDAAGKADVVSADRLATILHDHNALRMVFLNACEGARGGLDDSFTGTAQTLVRHGIPAVLAMQFEVSDAAAVALAHEFYSAVAAGYPVDSAVAEARKAIFAADNNEMEWGTPVLFTRSPDNQILEMPSGDARPVIKVQPWEPETVLVPAGAFLMGSPPVDNVPATETPQHVLHLPDFRIGKFPVTNHQYATFLRQNKDHPEPHRAGWFLRQPPGQKLAHPVVAVSWHDARAYCRWLSAKSGRRYRLPTEAEWEKAARGTSGWHYPWGDTWLDEHCNVDGDGTTAVDAFAEGISPFGCGDMLGNVQEWTTTIWGDSTAAEPYGYPYRADDGREDVAEERHGSRIQRVHRGGCFRNTREEVRSSMRGYAADTSRLRWRGFRVVLELPSA